MLIIQNQIRAGKIFKCTIFAGLRSDIFLLESHQTDQKFFFFFFIQLHVPFKIISLIETSQSIGGRNGRTPGKPPDTPASRTWLVSHVASAGLEPTPDTAVR